MRDSTDDVAENTLHQIARVRPRRILIVRLGAMGDVLHAQPAVQMIREALPEAEIGWAIERRWVPLLSASGFPLAGPTSPERPLVENVHVVDTRAWRKSLLSSRTFHSILSSLSGMRGQKYDVALDFQGAIKSAVVASLSGAASVIGFQEPRERAAQMLYSETVATSEAHVVDQNIALAREVLGGKESTTTRLPVDRAAEEWVATRLREIGASQFAILAPTAGWAAKEWPRARFGIVAAELAKLGLASLINFGPGEESIAEEVRAASSGTAIPFACDLSQLIALTRRAELFIGGDTGPMHLAAALDVPVVALFGPTDPARNGPYSRRARVLRSSKSVTSYSHVAQQDAGLAEISWEEVMEVATSLLRGSKD